MHRAQRITNIQNVIPTLKNQMVYNNPEKWVKTCAIQVTHMLSYNNR